ncbi:6-phosphogluconolactonase [Nocardiopsis coralliicola]
MTGVPGGSGDPAAPEVIVHPGAAELAEAAAARLGGRLAELQAERGAASVALTGGGIGIAMLEALAGSAARDAVDWSRLDVWWGDERFLPIGDPERNETQARQALLDAVPLDPARLHPMPAADGADGPEPEPGADRYARALAAAGPLDVVLLGVGPDTHVASLFPEFPALYEEERAAVAVRGAPKPPPTRVTLTLPAIRAAAEVWLLASGDGKAEAVRMALAPEAGPVQVPAAGARGTARTLVLLDRPAAAALPQDLSAPGRM